MLLVSAAGRREHEEDDMYEGELRGIELHLREGDYTADSNSLRAIHVLLEEIKRLRAECTRLQQETGYQM
jgi:hypothetical protein